MDNKKSVKLFLDGLSVGYDKKPLISGMTLHVAQGEIVTLIGPNGSGKTTVLRGISKQLALMAGTVYLDGTDTGRMSGRELAEKMAVVMTDRVFPDMMTCREMVAQGRYPYTGRFGLLSSHDREIIEDALRTVNAEDIADKDIANISDGERQRIFLARALAQEPEVIVLDEPTSFLDIRHKTELLDILHRFSRVKGITVVMSMHEIDLAERISDKIVCIKDGMIAGSGRPEDVFTDEMISYLYGMDKGSFNVLLGSIELGKPEGEPRVFVIGGEGYGIRFYRALQKKSIPFSAGILFKNDIDFYIAEALAATVVSAEPFTEIDGELIKNAKMLLDASEAVIDSGCPERELNPSSRILRDHARETGKRIILTPENLDEVEK